jgi:hypothetical protein
MDGCSSEANNNNMDDIIFDDDRSVSDVGVDFFDWEQIMREAENGEEDDSDISFDMEGVEEIPTDDEFEYDSDEEGSCASIVMKPKGYKPDYVPPNELSEDSKALLFWREEGDEKSFSDWRIKVEVEKTDDCSEAKVTIYNVHRLMLAGGPKHSGYFKALLQSDSFSENTDGMSTVKLPADIAQHFPDFLDYVYAQPVDSKFIIKFENWKSMKYLANYFIVPRLTEEVAEFIEKDMEYFNLEHMVNYVSEFNRDISDDMSRRILPKGSLCLCRNDSINWS